MEELYAFSYNPREEQSLSDGWDLYNLNNDYLQMGLPTRFWKITRINSEFGNIFIRACSEEFSGTINAVLCM